MLIKIPKAKKPVVPLTPHREAVFERKAEAKFQGQRETPNGRNFLWNRERFLTDADLSNYGRNYDAINWAKK
jgi:hypothetical protein